VSVRDTWLWWSSGKDSAWSLRALEADSRYRVTALVTTVNATFQRVAMHGVRESVLALQANRTGLPLHVVPLPYPCPNGAYETAFAQTVATARKAGVGCMAFGDLFLEDVRDYRLGLLAGTGMDALFPLWGRPTAALAHSMIAGGLEARVTCVDPRQLPGTFAGRSYDEAFLADLPATVDPCGENGEFHTCAIAGPMFDAPIAVITGETVERDGFVFSDLKLATDTDV
jgi:uncharacterized protein (TIGR00290 family)